MCIHTSIGPVRFITVFLGSPIHLGPNVTHPMLRLVYTIFVSKANVHTSSTHRSNTTYSLTCIRRQPDSTIKKKNPNALYQHDGQAGQQCSWRGRTNRRRGNNSHTRALGRSRPDMGWWFCDCCTCCNTICLHRYNPHVVRKCVLFC